MTITEQDAIELQKKYPDLEIKPHDCELTRKDHEVFYEFEQYKKNCAKNGIIMVSYVLVDRNEDDISSEEIGRRINSGSRKQFHWYDGKKWITLGKQNTVTQECSP